MLGLSCINGLKKEGKCSICRQWWETRFRRAFGHGRWHSAVALKLALESSHAQEIQVSVRRVDYAVSFHHFSQPNHQQSLKRSLVSTNLANSFFSLICKLQNFKTFHQKEIKNITKNQCKNNDKKLFLLFV